MQKRCPVSRAVSLNSCKKSSKWFDFCLRCLKAQDVLLKMQEPSEKINGVFMPEKVIKSF